MSSKEDGIIIILSSPSGAGKTTLANLLSKKNNFSISVSHTTREPRINEINGRDYYFVNKDHFKFDKCWNKDKYESFSADYKDEDIYEKINPTPSIHCRNFTRRIL